MEKKEKINIRVNTQKKSYYTWNTVMISITKSTTINITYKQACEHNLQKKKKEI